MTYNNDEILLQVKMGYSPAATSTRPGDVRVRRSSPLPSGARVARIQQAALARVRVHSVLAQNERDLARHVRIIDALGPLDAHAPPHLGRRLEELLRARLLNHAVVPQDSGVGSCD